MLVGEGLRSSSEKETPREREIERPTTTTTRSFTTTGNSGQPPSAVVTKGGKDYFDHPDSVGLPVVTADDRFQTRQQLSDRASRYRVHGVGSDVGERLQGESPLVQARVRNRQPRLRDHPTIIKQNVHVQGPGLQAVACSFAAALARTSRATRERSSLSIRLSASSLAKASHLGRPTPCAGPIAWASAVPIALATEIDIDTAERVTLSTSAICACEPKPLSSSS